MTVGNDLAAGLAAGCSGNGIESTRPVRKILATRARQNAARCAGGRRVRKPDLPHISRPLDWTPLEITSGILRPVERRFFTSRKARRIRAHHRAGLDIGAAI